MDGGKVFEVESELFGPTELADQGSAFVWIGKEWWPQAATDRHYPQVAYA